MNSNPIFKKIPVTLTKINMKERKRNSEKKVGQFGQNIYSTDNQLLIYLKYVLKHVRSCPKLSELVPFCPNLSEKKSPFRTQKQDFRTLLTFVNNRLLVIYLLKNRLSELSELFSPIWPTVLKKTSGFSSFHPQNHWSWTK